MPHFDYRDPLPVEKDHTAYRQLDGEDVKEVVCEGRKILKVDSRALTHLAAEAMRDVSHLLRRSHLEKLAAILKDPEASRNDRFVARELLKNAVIAADMVLPGCQDTGTAVVFAKKGEAVWTGGSDAAVLSEGIAKTYTETNLRYSQMAPLTMYEEVNTGNNLPAQIDIAAVEGDEYHFLFLAKGGGSANKSFLFQESKALLNPKSLEKFVREKIVMLGTTACPPYHLAFVIGGTSAESTLKILKLATAGYLDGLPTAGNRFGQAFRDLETEDMILKISREVGIGAQFGGKYFCHDVRVIRLPRHAASCPIGMGVSCSADRNIKGKITAKGVFLEALERDPARFLPEPDAQEGKGAVEINLNRPMKEILAELSQYPVATRLSLSGTLIVARDVAHAKLKERLDRGEGLPEYFRKYPVYYAGPAKTPAGYASGSFGPTTAGRMDAYVSLFQKEGASLIMLAKGNRSRAVTEACAQYGGFYLGSIGGPAAALAQEHIRKVEVLDYPELGMEAVYKIDIAQFPAFIIVDDKGNDFFAQF